jgi:hypothetical protein
VTEATLTFAMTARDGRRYTPDEIKARTELVLDGRFARIARVEDALGTARVAFTPRVPCRYAWCCRHACCCSISPDLSRCCGART